MNYVPSLVTLLLTHSYDTFVTVMLFIYFVVRPWCYFLV